MTVDEIINLITSIGFPIVAYFALFYYMVKRDNDHSEEIKSLAKTVENNTIVLTKIVSEMEDLQKHE